MMRTAFGTIVNVNATGLGTALHPVPNEFAKREDNLVNKDSAVNVKLMDKGMEEIRDSRMTKTALGTIVTVTVMGLGTVQLADLKEYAIHNQINVVNAK